ncbi:MAG: endopeptidase La [Clostridiales bacterium]|jgi:ATP-dependent Lon protease|nr:endopeptidase La [Clostridiales bacterium]MDR2713297.1 endopeptidase La [Clostridiales bacterium]
MILQSKKSEVPRLVNEVIKIPLLPLRGMLLYPYMFAHLDVGRDRSIQAIHEAMSNSDKLLFLSMQKDPQTDEPEPEDIYEVGTVAIVKQRLQLPGGSIRILVEGLYRARMLRCSQTKPYMFAELVPLKETVEASAEELEALMRLVHNSFEELSRLDKKIPPEALAALDLDDEPQHFADMVAGALSLKLPDRQALLEEASINKRLELLLHLSRREKELLELERDISARVRQQMEKNQKEYYLREQIKAIQQELGDKDDRSSEVEELRHRIEESKLPPEILERVNRELDRLARMPSMVAEAMVVRNYIDWVLDLPWSKETTDRIDLQEAKAILEADHYGLEEAKERVLEYLASHKLKAGLKGPILCLVGPPGVGKTSLARSMARCLGRQFVRMSLGGIRDEAEIRGHRRTYIGAMPGRIIQLIKQAGSKNPLFLLDEIDKLGSDFRGDPSSALLEALDPEQNVHFSDHYIEAPFDLSHVMFITTANVQYDIPRPLLDRMEIISVSSYTEEEKLQIALQHLLPKQIKEHGLEEAGLFVSDNAMRSIIRQYTREAGVRELERKLAKICRRVGHDLVLGEIPPFKVTQGNIESYLGIPRFSYGKIDKEPQVGVVTGLAWTEVGGDLLQIEVQTLPGKGKMTITGQLGDIMKESAQAGFTYIRSIGQQLGIADNIEESTDFHIHVPEGAIPKDGPSAGTAMAAALASQLTGRQIASDLAMTGEVTLRGHVLAVGGIKEKILAAHRGGCRQVILPLENKKDMEDIPSNIRKKLKLHFVKSMQEVLDLALLPMH